LKSGKSAKRIERVIVGIVALFVVVVVGTLVVRSRLARVETEVPEATGADLRVKQAQIEEVTEGVRWRLRADQALLFGAEGRTHLQNVQVSVFERDRSWTMVGEEGDLYEATKNVEIRRNVVLTSSDGFRLETSVLRWQGEERRIWTDAPVRLSREGAVVSGMALEVRMEDEVTTLRGRVRATFARGEP